MAFSYSRYLCGLSCAAILLLPFELFAAEPMGSLATISDLDPIRVSLGRKLFHDTRLSRDNSISCASCHPLNRGGVDGLDKSLGVEGRVGLVNAPTVYNAALSFRLMWDGGMETLEQQAAGPIHNPLEMDSNWEQVVAKLSQDSSLVSFFEAAYQDGINAANIADAIAEFERTLITPGSSFDLWSDGDSTALDQEALQGYDLFKRYGCVACHQGQNLGGNMFQRFGIFGDYFADRGNIGKGDYGRYNVTGREADRFVFRVPSLRNIELTAPYFHDGSVATLHDSVRTMAKYQLGIDIPNEDIGPIVAFLKSLTGSHLELEQ